MTEIEAMRLYCDVARSWTARMTADEKLDQLEKAFQAADDQEQLAGLAKSRADLQRLRASRQGHSAARPLAREFTQFIQDDRVPMDARYMDSDRQVAVMTGPRGKR